MEDLLYEMEAVRRFAGLRLTGPLPDETTMLHFLPCWRSTDWGGVVRGDHGHRAAEPGRR